MSAHAGTLMRGGGVHARRQASRSRSAFSLGEIGLRLTEVGDLLVDMRGEGLGNLVCFETEISGQQRAYPRRPIQPCITLRTELLEKDGLRGIELDKRPGLLFVLELAEQREVRFLFSSASA
ncbi:hypothetical protein OMK73_11570 [Cupriavidus sp. D39]|nr:hypothetical protein [Cupriavidus sp. D39]